LLGVLGADQVTLIVSNATGAFESKTVGASKTVHINGLELAGAAAANYALSQPATNADITPAGLTVSGITASNKVYDGGTNATLDTTSASLVGVISGDTVTLDTSSALGAFGNKTVGTAKAVTISGLTISGTDSGNYSLTQPTASANITPAGLTVT